MSVSKKPRKKTRRERMHAREQRKKVEACRLYRWEKSDNTEGYFDVYGPYSKEENLRLMDKAIARTMRWSLVVTTYFLTPEGDYYEEQLITGPHSWNVAQDFKLIHSLIGSAIADTVASGEPEEYQDTCSALYLYTPELEASLDADSIIQQRATVALAKREQGLALQET